MFYRVSGSQSWRHSTEDAPHKHEPEIAQERHRHGHGQAHFLTFFGRPTLRAAPPNGIPSRFSAAVASSVVLISKKAKRAFMRMDRIGLGALQSPTCTNAPPRYSCTTCAVSKFSTTTTKTNTSKVFQPRTRTRTRPTSHRKQAATSTGHEREINKTRNRQGLVAAVATISRQGEDDGRKERGVGMYAVLYRHLEDEKTRF